MASHVGLDTLNTAIGSVSGTVMQCNAVIIILRGNQQDFQVPHYGKREAKTVAVP